MRIAIDHTRFDPGGGCLAGYPRYSVDGLPHPRLRGWKRVSPHQRAVLYAERRRFAPAEPR